MHRVVIRLAAVVLALTLSTLAVAVPAVGELPPAWQGQGSASTTVAFDPARLSKPTVLLFWATWCPYCKKLMPHVQNVLDQAGDQALDVYALSFREDEDADPAAVLKAKGQHFTLVLEAEAIAEQYGVRGTPVLLLVGRDGRVKYVRPNGASPDAVETALRRELQLPAASAAAQ